jgi:hypothetical protein
LAGHSFETSGFFRAAVSQVWKAWIGQGERGKSGECNCLFRFTTSAIIEGMREVFKFSPLKPVLEKA